MQSTKTLLTRSTTRLLPDFGGGGAGGSTSSSFYSSTAVRKYLLNEEDGETVTARVEETLGEDTQLVQFELTGMHAFLGIQPAAVVVNFLQIKSANDIHVETNFGRLHFQRNEFLISGTNNNANSKLSTLTDPELGPELLASTTASIGDDSDDAVAGHKVGRVEDGDKGGKADVAQTKTAGVVGGRRRTTGRGHRRNRVEMRSSVANPDISQELKTLYDLKHSLRAFLQPARDDCVGLAYFVNVVTVPEFRNVFPVDVRAYFALAYLAIGMLKWSVGVLFSILALSSNGYTPYVAFVGPVMFRSACAPELLAGEVAMAIILAIVLAFDTKRDLTSFELGSVYGWALLFIPSTITWVFSALTLLSLSNLSAVMNLGVQLLVVSQVDKIIYLAYSSDLARIAGYYLFEYGAVENDIRALSLANARRYLMPRFRYPISQQRSHKLKRPKFAFLVVGLFVLVSMSVLPHYYANGVHISQFGQPDAIPHRCTCIPDWYGASDDTWSLYHRNATEAYERCCALAGVNCIDSQQSFASLLERFFERYS